MATTTPAPARDGAPAHGPSPHPWRSLAAALWRQVRPVSRAERLVVGAGTLLLALGLAHLGVFAVDEVFRDGGGWAGPLSWRKPVVFGLSFGLLLVTVGVVLRQLPSAAGQWLVALPLAVASLVEYLAITSQRWRGVPSHFNDATAYDIAVFDVMGAAVAVVVLCVAGLALWSALPLRRGGFAGGGALRLAVLVGLGAVLVSGWVGARMIVEGTAVVERTGAVPDPVTFGADGSAKLFHAAGQHGLQVLLALALLLVVTNAPPRRALLLVGLASAGYAAVLTGVGAAALRGESWLTLPLSLLLPAVPGAVVLSGVALAVLAHVRRAAHQEGAVVR